MERPYSVTLNPRNTCAAGVSLLLVCAPYFLDQLHSAARWEVEGQSLRICAFKVSFLPAKFRVGPKSMGEKL
jgi:hypothetical protein